MIQTMDYRGLDFSKLLTRKDGMFRAAQERAAARIARFYPLNVADRFEQFSRIGYRPHGMYVPADADAQTALAVRAAKIGEIDDGEQRLQAYFDLQYETDGWAQQGIPGRWTGQQGIHRSTAKYRIVAMGRRSGKTFGSAREALAVALAKPRSCVWIAAPNMGLVARCFDMIVRLVMDCGIGYTQKRDSAQEKKLVIPNGSVFEGVSLELGAENAGAAVDFVIVDEAARVKDSQTWERDILPTLADRDGQALIISSWEGEGGFFFDKYEDARDKKDPDWEIFTAPSWENFFEFPQGRKSPKIQRMERGMSPLNFLESFGAIPRRSQDVVYPEFKERIHVGSFPYNPDHPVVLAVDPSGGGRNPYAVIAIQDYGDWFAIIDEYYESNAIVESISPELKTRPWFSRVTEVVLDSESPAEVVRWNNLGWNAYPVFEKPQVWMTLPFVRRQLRDPLRFYAFYREKANQVLLGMGYSEDYDQQLPLDQQQLLAIYVEEKLADNNLTDADVERLRDCARLRIDRRCINTIEEFKKYHYPKTKGRTQVVRENPEKDNDHALDACRYFILTYKQYEENEDAPARSYIFPKEQPEPEPEQPVEKPRLIPRTPGQGFLGHMRDIHSAPNTVGQSYLVATG